MRNTTPKRYAIPTALSVTLIVTACGSDDAGDTGAGTTTGLTTSGESTAGTTSTSTTTSATSGSTAESTTADATTSESTATADSSAGSSSGGSETGELPMCLDLLDEPACMAEPVCIWQPTRGPCIIDCTKVEDETSCVEVVYCRWFEGMCVPQL